MPVNFFGLKEPVQEERVYWQLKMLKENEEWKRKIIVKKKNLMKVWSLEVWKKKKKSKKKVIIKWDE